jgi:hypothetical protein
MPWATVYLSLFSMVLPDDDGGMLTRLNRAAVVRLCQGSTVYLSLFSLFLPDDAVVRVCHGSTIYLSLFSLFLPDDDGGMLTRLNRAALVRACHGSTI